MTVRKITGLELMYGDFITFGFLTDCFGKRGVTVSVSLVANGGFRRGPAGASAPVTPSPAPPVALPPRSRRGNAELNRLNRLPVGPLKEAHPVNHAEYTTQEGKGPEFSSV